MISNTEVINKYNSILLVGYGKTNKYLLDIVRPDTADEAYEFFGSCDLSDSFALLKAMGAANVYVANIETPHDFLEISLLIKKYNFAYVVPLIHLSDVFYDPMSNGLKTFYIQYLLRNLSEDTNCETTIIATDAKADLFKDIDSFLKDMDDKLQNFKYAKRSNERYENILFVANNLDKVAFANVYLAGMIVNAEANEYPSFIINRSNSIFKNIFPTFNMDPEDVSNEVIYFKSHKDGTLTVENLLDLYPIQSLIKIFTILRIIKFIGMDMDFNDFIGKAYTGYQEKQIERYANDYLDSYVGTYIIGYRILSVYAVPSTSHPGTVNIFLKYKIQPINCTEEYTVEKKIV